MGLLKFRSLSRTVLDMLKKISKLFSSFGLILGASMGTSASVDEQIVLFETSLGNFIVETYSDKSPITVANFLNYVESGFYDGIIFHRVIQDFVVQAGGFDSNMVYKEPEATIKNESSNGLQNLTKTLAMARTSDPDSASSQFYVNLKDNLFLDFKPGQPGYAVFGKVIGGWEVIQKIAEQPTSPSDRPHTDIMIKSTSLMSRSDVSDILDVSP